MQKIYNLIFGAQAESKVITPVILPSPNKVFWGYPFVIAIMSCLQVLAVVYGRKYVSFLGFDIGLGSLLFTPMILYIFEITVECYGWQYGRQIVWCNFIVNGLTTVFAFILKLVPFSHFTHTNLAYSYSNLIDTMWIPAAAIWVCIFFADYIASIILSQTRLKYQGRFALSRIILIHCIAEVILLSGNFVVMPLNGYSIGDTVHIIMNTFYGRSLSSLALLPLVRFAVWLIQHKVEGVVVFDYRRDFSLFKFKVDNNMLVQFCTKKWDTLSTQDKKELNIERAVLLYQSTNAVINFKNH